MRRNNQDLDGRVTAASVAKNVGGGALAGGIGIGMMVGMCLAAGWGQEFDAKYITSIAPTVMTYSTLGGAAIGAVVGAIGSCIKYYDYCKNHPYRNMFR